MSNEHPTDPGVGKNNPDQPEPPLCFDGTCH